VVVESFSGAAPNTPASARKASTSVGTTSNFEAAIDLSKLPLHLTETIRKKAPFVLGSNKAIYDKDFFHVVVGLSNTGKKTFELNPEDSPQMWREWKKVKNRMFISDKVGEEKSAQFHTLFKQVYGWKPENSSSGIHFAMAASSYLSDSKPKEINWASLALDIANTRGKNGGRSPLKNCPPCLHKQVQCIVDEVGAKLNQSASAVGNHPLQDAPATPKPQTVPRRAICMYDASTQTVEDLSQPIATKLPKRATIHIASVGVAQQTVAFVEAELHKASDRVSLASQSSKHLLPSFTQVVVSFFLKV
jgi:hypothetical protein